MKKVMMLAMLVMVATMLFAGVAYAQIISGTSGPDRLIGTQQDDSLRGHNGPDLLVGKGGDDELRGGRGKDTCKGGPGDDTFVSCEVRLD